MARALEIFIAVASGPKTVTTKRASLPMAWDNSRRQSSSLRKPGASPFKGSRRNQSFERSMTGIAEGMS